MRKLFLMMVLVLTSFTAAAAERPLIARGSEVQFSFTQMNVPVQGHFGKFSGHIAVDAAMPETSSVDMQVDVASISAGDDTDSEAVKPEWLGATAFPQARFVSKSAKPLGENRYEATGAFTLKGMTRDVTVPFEIKEQAGGNADISGQFQIKRGDFKVGEGEWSAFDVVANEVLIKFHLVLGPAAKH